jgi:hypothetical protein
MAIDWNAVTALATVVLVIGTLIVEYLKGRRDRQMSSASSVMELAEKWESSNMIAHRKKLAGALLQTGVPGQLEYAVLDFFEHIGMNARKHLLEADMVWNSLSVPIMAYYQALRYPQDIFERWRKDDPLALVEFEWLYGMLLGIECTKRAVPPEQCYPTPPRVREFLESERDLTP